MSLSELVFQLNTHETSSGTTFDAMLSDSGILEVSCSNNDEFPINIVKTETQLLAVTPLFSMNEIKTGQIHNLNEELLFISPVVPLSSLGRQGDNYILFGAMPLDSSFENIIHELEVQAENTLEVLQAIEPLLA